MMSAAESACRVSRRSPHGERGLKSQSMVNESRAASRSPHGERGLKLQDLWNLLTARVALLMESVD